MPAPQFTSIGATVGAVGTSMIGTVIGVNTAVVQRAAISVSVTGQANAQASAAAGTAASASVA